MHDCWESVKNFTVLKVDFSNAFNSIERPAMLQQCAAVFPELLPFVAWCYDKPSTLLYNGKSLSSQVGVQQGDPLGPLLFALTLQPILAEIATKCDKLVVNRWYLDDGVIAGEAAEVSKALSIVREVGPMIGLELNLRKCELYSSNSDMLRELFPAEIVCKSAEACFSLLGAPIGSKDFCSDFVRAAAEKAAKLLMEIESLEESPQAGLHLVRSSAGFCRLVHIARATPPELIQEQLKAFDERVTESVQVISGVVEMPAHAVRQSRLGLAVGGLGFRSLEMHCSAAYVSSVISTMAKGVVRSLDSALTLYNARSGDSWSVDSIFDQKPSQKLLSAKLDATELASLVGEMALVDQMRMKALSEPHAAAWLRALPNRLPFNNCLSPAQVSICLRHRLGVPFKAQLCRLCVDAAKSIRGQQRGAALPSVPMDTAGHHALAVCKYEGHATRRHNRLRDRLYRICQSVNLGALVEQEAQGRRPADLLLLSVGFAGREASALDFVVTSPLSYDYAQADKCATKEAEARKHLENDAACKREGWACVPMAVNTYGGWGEEAVQLIARVAAQVARNRNSSVSVATCFIYNTLGVVLARNNATALLARYSDTRVGESELRLGAGVLE